MRKTFIVHNLTQAKNARRFAMCDDNNESIKSEESWAVTCKIVVINDSNITFTMFVAFGGNSFVELQLASKKKLVSFLMDLENMEQETLENYFNANVPKVAQFEGVDVQQMRTVDWENLISRLRNIPFSEIFDAVPTFIICLP